jgi:exopolysaccharide biosynthesis operon protein EpsL
LTYPATTILAAWLAMTLVQGSAAAAAPQAHGQQTAAALMTAAAAGVPPRHSSDTAAQLRWTRSDRGDNGDHGALQRLLSRLQHSAPAPVPDEWALLVAGLIGAGAIARRRVSLMRGRSLFVPRSSAAPQPHVPQPQLTQKITLCLASVLLLPALHVRAQDAAKVTPFVEETLTNDDNVFRVSKDVDPATVTGSRSRADTYRTTSFGLSADVPVSLQRLVGSLTFNSTRYQRFSGLDFNGHDLRGSWLWQVGKDLRGEVGLSDTYSLASFAQLLSTTPDELRVRQEFVNGTWMVTPYWRLRAAGDRLEQRNSAPATLFNDVTNDGVEAALSRVSKAGNSIGFSTRVESGKFPTAERFTTPLSTTLIDNAYRQYAAGLTLDWTVTGVSRLVARADHVSRRYDQLPQRNFTGQTGRIELTWTPTGKMTLIAIAQRDISPYEFTRSSLVLLKGFGLRPAWHVTPKIDLSADLEAVTRSYVADPAQALGLTGQRDDRVRSMSALFSYHPVPRIGVQASLLHETRSSNAAFGDYAANVAWLNARFAF